MKWLRAAIRDWWDKFVDFIFRQIEGFYNLMSWLVNSIVYYFWAVVDYIIGMVWDWCYYLYDLFLGEDGFVWYVFDCVIEWGDYFVTEVLPDLSSILGPYAPTFEFAMGLIGRLDAFFPITECSVLLGIYVAFMSIFLVCRFILKLFPGLGG